MCEKKPREGRAGYAGVRGTAWGSGQEWTWQHRGEHLGSPLAGPAGMHQAPKGAEQAEEGQRTWQPGR